MKLKNVTFELRKQIDIIDDTILDLINSRFELVKLIGEIKDQNGLSIVDYFREREILLRLIKINISSKGRLDSITIETIFTIIILAAREIQNKKI